MDTSRYCTKVIVTTLLAIVFLAGQIVSLGASARGMSNESLFQCNNFNSDGSCKGGYYIYWVKRTAAFNVPITLQAVLAAFSIVFAIAASSYIVPRNSNFGYSENILRAHVGGYALLISISIGVIIAVCTAGVAANRWSTAGLYAISLFMHMMGSMAVAWLWFPWSCCVDPDPDLVPLTRMEEGPDLQQDEL